MPLNDRRKSLIIKVFQEMDPETKGYITLDTLRHQLRAENFDPVKFKKVSAEKYADSIIGLFNADDCGRVSVEEWLAFCADLR